MTIQDLPRAHSCRIVPLADARVVPGFVEGTWLLVVSGEKPCCNMEVRLLPVVYGERPDYWTIEVVGCLSDGFCLETVAPYTVSFDLGGNVGTEGIEVVGADGTRKIATQEFGR